MAVNFAKRMRAIREENDWTLDEMAQKLGTTKQALSKYERGERTPKITVVAKFADVLHVPLEDLIGETSDSNRLYAQDSMPKRPPSPVRYGEETFNIGSDIMKVNPDEITVTPDQTKIYLAMGRLAKIDKEAAVTLFETLIDKGVL